MDGGETNALILSVIFGGVVAACGMLLRSAAECKCFLDVSLKIIRDCCQCLGSSFVTCSLLWCVVFIVVGIVEIVDTSSISGATFMTNFAISQGGSWLFEGPILTAKFFWTWKSERNLPESDTQLLEYRKLKAEFKAKRKGGGGGGAGVGGAAVSPIAANQMMVMSTSTDNGKSVPAGSSGSGMQIAAIGPAPLMPPVSTQPQQSSYQQQQQPMLPGMVSIDVAPPTQQSNTTTSAGTGAGPGAGAGASISNAMSSAAASFASAFRSGTSAQPTQSPPPPQTQPSVPFSTNMQFTNTQPTPGPVIIAASAPVAVVQPAVVVMQPTPQPVALHFGGSAVATTSPTGMSGNMGSDIGLGNGGGMQPTYYQPQPPNGFGTAFAPGGGFSHTQPQPMMYQTQPQQQPVMYQHHQPQQQPMQMQMQPTTHHTYTNSSGGGGQMMMAASPQQPMAQQTGSGELATTPATLVHDLKKALPQSLGRFL